MELPDPFGWVGATIDGQFSVESIAGEGGCGIVYRGTHLGLESTVAIKCLHLPTQMSASQRDALLTKFRAEARLLHRLSRQTANIVQALDVGAATAPNGQWTPYIIMEWVDGDTLAKDLRVRRDAGQPPRGLEESLRLLGPAADALAVAHEDNVSHRDVKPANLFITKSRIGPGMKVVDFGIAKVFSETPSIAEALAHTSEPHRVFTPIYGAPEQFTLDLGATGPWTDVYAMALIVIEVASGRRVLSSRTVIDLFRDATESARRTDLLDGVALNDSPVAAVLRRALDPKPASRYRSMGEFWAALEQARRGSPNHPLAALTPATSVPASERPASSRQLLSSSRLSHSRSRAAPGERTGATLDGARMPLAATGENRICTVMLVSLAGVAALSARLESEEVKEVHDRCLATVTEQVEALGGVVQGSAGDAVIAVFGVPRTSDNDAERAVVAALRVQSAIGRLALPRAARSSRLSAPIGINTGRVFARVSHGLRGVELAVVGDAVSIAARLQQAAPPGAIVVGRDTHRQIVGRFNVEPLSPVAIPGRSEMLPCYRVLSAIPFQASFATAEFHGIETKLVGRAAERQRMIDGLETVLSERKARLVTLVGPPGVGRSRLLADFFASLVARSESFLVMTAQCSPLSENTSYGLAASLLRRRFEIPEGDPVARTRKRLRVGVRWFRLRTAERDVDDTTGPLELPRDLALSSSLRDLSLSSAPRDLSLSLNPFGEDMDLRPVEIDAAIHQIQEILGAGPGSGVGSNSITLDEPGRAAKQRISAAAALLVRFTARRTPVVMLCDDLHWADDASLDLLSDLVRRVSDLPVLLLCSARPELLERRPEWGAEDDASERIQVAPLARRYIEEMVKDRLRRFPELSPELVRVLADRAEGNPLILEETLHLLVDAGVIEARGEDAWGFHEERLGALTLPPTIQGIVQSRLDRLDPDLREVLGEAAVVGRTFWLGTVEHLRREGRDVTSSVSSAPADLLLGKLRERQLIRVRDKATLPGEREAMFAESATQEVAYEMLSVKVRRPLHLLVAGWLEKRVAPAAGAALLAFHYDRGDDLARAATAYVRAATHAASLGENAEALRHLERARGIHDEERDAARSGDEAWDGQERRIASHRERVRLRLDLGDALRRAGRLDDAARAYEEARARVLRKEQRPGWAFDRHEAQSWDARIDARLALVHKLRGSIAEARVLIERAIVHATEAGVVEETPSMYALLAFLHRRERHPDESWRSARKGLRTCRGISQRDERWQENVGQLLLGVAAALYARGRMVSAERTYRQIARLVSDATHPHIIGMALNGVAGARLSRGDLRGARDALLRSLRFKERAGDLHQIAVGYSNLAEVEIRLKESAAALEHARRAVRLGEQSRAGSDLADMYRNLAEASLGAGEIDAAIDAGQRALSIAEVRGRVYLGDVAVTLARACARAHEGGPAGPAGPAGTASREKAAEAAKALLVSLSRHFEDGDLPRKAEECRSLLMYVNMSP